MPYLSTLLVSFEIFVYKNIKETKLNVPDLFSTWKRVLTF